MSLRNIQSNTVRRIEIVDEYPAIEEENVLYFKRDIVTPSTPITNLYNPTQDKEQTSTTSGYSYAWKTNSTLEFNTTTYLAKDVQKNSDSFMLNLTQGHTYKLAITYIGGIGVNENDETVKLSVSLYNKTTSTKLASTGAVFVGNNADGTYVATANEDITAELQLYAYTNGWYQAVSYKIELYEVN